MASRPTIFLSYTRRDASGVKAADALERRLTDDGFDVWRDQTQLEGGYSWASAIEREIEKREVMVAVISPGYRDSDICRAEHVLALRAGHRVIPMLTERGAPPPLHLVNTQFLEASDFAGLLRALGSLDTAALKPEFQKRRSNITSERRPERFVPRPEELDALKRLILSEDSSRSTSIVGVRGQGGIGKSVLAAELARDRAIEAAFPDGIVWLPIGREPRDLPTFLREAARTLGDGSGDYSTELAAYNSFRECVRDKAALLVLDDIWEPRHVRPFLPLDDADAPRLRLVCTTRDRRVTFALDAREYSVDMLQPAAAREFLAKWVGCPASKLPPQAQTILDHCRGHALALKQVGSLLGQMLRESFAEAWDHVIQELVRLPFDEDLAAIMEASLSAMPELARERYLDLAVFPEETPIPMSVLPGYWKTDAHDALRTVKSWLDLSLVEKSPANLLTLHDIQLDYVKARRESPSLHGRLVDAATDDDYFVARLPYHLKKAGREPELEALLLNPDWLRKKLNRMGTAAVRADFAYASSEACSILARALDLSSHVLSREPDQFAFQLYGRLLDQPNAEVRNLLQVLKPELALRPLRRCLDAPGAIIRRLEGHSGGVNAVAVTPDGTRAVSGSYDNTLIVWDLATGAMVRRLEGHSIAVSSVAVTPDGLGAVSGSHDHTLIVWDQATGAIVRRLEGHSSNVTSVAVTPDGSRAVSGSFDNTLIVWNLATGAIVRRLEGHSSNVTSVAVTPDGSRAVSGSYDKTLIVWDLATGAMVRRLEGHSSEVWSVAVKPDGLRAVADSYNTLIVWDLATGAMVRLQEGHSGLVMSVAVTPDGSRAVSGSVDHTLIVWDLATGAIMRRLEGHSSWVTSVAVTPDGSRAVSASSDNTLIVWNLATGAMLPRLEVHSKEVNSVGMMPDGSRAVSGSWDNMLIMWDLETGALLRRLEGHSSGISSVALTPDGSRAVSGSYDKTLIVWDLATGAMVWRLEGHSNWVLSLALTPDGSRAVSGSHDTTLIVWDLATGAMVRRLEGHSGAVRSVAVMPDGSRAVSGSWDNTLIVWDLATHAMVQRLEGHSGGVNSVAVTPDGSRAISGSYDKKLIVWDLATGTMVRRLEGDSGTVNSVAVTPDGSRAVSASDDRTLKMWDLAAGRCLRTYALDTPVNAVAIYEQRVIAGDALGNVHFFDLVP